MIRDPESTRLRNSTGFINPATEEKQDDIVSGLDNVEIEKNLGTLSPNNSSTTPLGIDAVFTGVTDDIKDHVAINISVWADQASATDGLSMEWSQDGTNWDEKMTVSIAANKVESYEFGVRARYFRIVYTNGSIAQTAFRLQTIFHPTRTRLGARCLCVDIDPREFAATRRAVLAAKKPNDDYTNIHATAGGNLKVSVEETNEAISIDLEGKGNLSVGVTQVEVVIAGTPTQIRIRADTSNTGIIFIGKTGILSNGTNDFVRLESGDEIILDYNDTTNELYAISDTASQVINYGAIL